MQCSLRSQRPLNSSFSRFVEKISSSGEGLSVFPTTFAGELINSSTKKMTDMTFIIIGALATAFLLLTVLLILGLLYYRWRLSDSQHTLVRFIRENFRLREKLNENGIY